MNFVYESLVPIRFVDVAGPTVAWCSLILDINHPFLLLHFRDPNPVVPPTVLTVKRNDRSRMIVRGEISVPANHVELAYTIRRCTEQ